MIRRMMKKVAKIFKPKKLRREIPSDPVNLDYDKPSFSKTIPKAAAALKSVESNYDNRAIVNQQPEDLKKFDSIFPLDADEKVESAKEEKVESANEEKIGNIKKRAADTLIDYGSVKKNKKTVEMNDTEDGKLNKNKPIWARNPEEISKVEYDKFYKSLTNDWEDHMAVKHINFKGQFEFHALLFVPKRVTNEVKNIRLYARRVFVIENSEVLLPNYLNFMSGVVDSEGLPFNISREALKQHHEILKFISKNLLDECLELFEELAEDKDEFKKFYYQFGKNLKLGVQEDLTNRARIVDLLRFHTSVSGDEFCSLSEYVDRMKSDQEDILFITGESKDEVSKSASVEFCKNLGFEIIFLLEFSDKFVIQQLAEFKGKRLTCAKKYHESNFPVSETPENRAQLIVHHTTRVMRNGVSCLRNSLLRKSVEIFQEMKGGGGVCDKDKTSQPILKNVAWATVTEYPLNLKEISRLKLVRQSRQSLLIEFRKAYTATSKRVLKQPSLLENSILVPQDRSINADSSYDVFTLPDEVDFKDVENENPNSIVEFISDINGSSSNKRRKPDDTGESDEGLSAKRVAID